MKKDVGRTNQMILRFVSLLPGALLLLLPSVIHAQEAPEQSAKLTVMSKELLEGISIDGNTNRLHVAGGLRALSSTGENGVYADLFRLDASYPDSIASASELEKIGVVAVGTATFTLPDGSIGEYSFGFANFEFMGEMKESRIIFGPEGVEAVLGVSALQSIGFSVDAVTHSLSRVTSN